MRPVHFPLIAFTSLLMFASPAYAAFKIRTMDIAGERHLVFSDIAKYYGMSFKMQGDTITLQSKYSLLRFGVNDRRATVNGVKVTLCLAVRQSGGHAVLSELDFRRTLDPLIRDKVLSGGGVKTIVIDPGHGGADAGAVGKLAQEKNVNLAVAQMVAYNLKRRGYQVHLTRASDKAVSLADRVKATQRIKPDLFVSLHVNSASAAAARGIETFALTPQGAASTHSTERKDKATPGNVHDRENIRLAFEIQKYLMHHAQTEDRGVKRANFMVIRDAPCPAVLVEMGFISNPPEERRLNSADHQRLLAAGIINGILAYDNALRAP